MIGSRSPWALRLTSPAPRSVAHSQRRSKTFVRRVDKNNEVYYTISNKRPPKSPDSIPVRDDFFEMPDLLLDLDAEGSRFVRPVEEADDERLERRWDVDPRRAAVQDHLRRLRSQISESRRKADHVLSDPTNIWRLTSHDILSAALRGSPTAAGEPQTATATSEAFPGPGKPAPGQATGLTEALCRENGVPPHAMQDERILLEWMLLRHRNLKRSMANRSEEPPSPLQLAAALRNQTSIAGIRRLVFSSLRSGETADSYFRGPKEAEDGSDGTPDVSREIRNACFNALHQHQHASESAAHLEILGFIGNLNARLSLHGRHVGPALAGLALRLSAAAGVTGATSEWLHRGFANNTWEQSDAPSGDVAEALRTFVQHLRSPAEGGLLFSVHDRQLLLQLLTGIDEHHSLSGDSFRSLPLFYLGEQSRVPTDEAYDMYASYVMLLGHLGAARTLWKEWHVSRPTVTRFLKPNDDIQRLERLYRASLLSALRVAAPLEARGIPDMELGECVALDYHSIGAQDVGSWLDNGRETAVSGKPTGSASSSCLPSFNLPLDEWIVKLEGAFREDPSSAHQ
ncbi:hypothetical protein Trco_000442 [Trichoderma cornu-damae]|uniref:Uncharacterized protein n=1 Tax=Trichoderma cornu-damae TaxID=654480 RepID=A0A9P8QXF4_9HYPO|nr:hypothetical protein Trco_000442 [Trichoderma cornu-damae]